MIRNQVGQRGVTMFELLISIAILGILAAIAAPYYGDYIAKQRWVGAAEAVYGQLQQAKRAAISNNTTVNFNILSASSSNWCIGYTDQASCNCKTANSCQVNGQNTLVVKSDNYPDVELTNSSSDTAISGSFTMPGISADKQTLLIRSSALGNKDIQLVISDTGNVKICSDSTGQYPSC